MKYNDYLSSAEKIMLVGEGDNPFTGKCDSIIYNALGLAGETGEVVDEIKKVYRDGNILVRLEKIKLELGDVIWYWTILYKKLGLNPEDIFEANINKLSERKRAK